jgi:hypothetical protein
MVKTPVLEFIVEIEFEVPPDVSNVNVNSPVLCDTGVTFTVVVCGYDTV